MFEGAPIPKEVMQKVTPLAQKAPSLAEDDEEDENTIVCTRCGFPNSDPNAKFCTGCGSKLSQK
jgi:ribosomal protein L37E